MKEKILEGLKTLDTKADAQWTQEGLVNLNAFKFVLGGEAVTREQLDEVAPGFNRETAATYFEPATGEGTAPVAPVAAGNVATEQKTSELTVDVKLGLSETLRTLMGIGSHDISEVADLSAEQLAGAMKDVPERRSALITLREEFNALMSKEFNLLIAIEEAYDRSIPKENHADLVKRIHEANMNSKFVVDQPRQRVAPVIPPMKK